MIFFAVSGRYQVAVGAYSTLGLFNQQNQEAAEISDFQKTIEGSIYFEDWDKKTLHDFVVDYVKHMYQKCEQEIERRKVLIAEEEANLAQYRPS